MLIVEPVPHARAPKTFDESGLVKAIIPGTEWPRMLELHRNDGVNCFVISHERHPDEFFRGLKRGSLVIRYGVGYDSIPIELCRECGILVANTPGTLDQSVAEHAVSLMLAAARHTVVMDNEMKAGTWRHIEGRELKGSTVAVIGFGNIGRAFATIAKFGFGMRVVAFDRNESIRTAHATLFDRFTTNFEEAVREADYVTVHVDLNPSTTGFINAERLRLLKQDAILVNTSRGKVINEPELYASLKAGRPALAALDVFHNEPYEPLPGADLRTLPNVLMAPHVASHTVASNRRMAGSCVTNARKYLEGKLGELTIIPELKELVKGMGA